MKKVKNLYIVLGALAACGITMMCLCAKFCPEGCKCRYKCCCGKPKEDKKQRPPAPAESVVGSEAQ